MLRRFPAAFRLAHFSLACVGLMWALPFLYYHHAYPLTTFDQEWGAVLLGLCAMPLLATKRFWRQPAVPRIVLLPVGLMMVILLQAALGLMPYLGTALLAAEYLLWAALLTLLGRQLREELGLPTVAVALAAFLLAGAEAGALVGVLQHFSWHTFLDTVITARTSGVVFGNMGQPNHYADYTTLGLVSLGLLSVQGRTPPWQTALLAAPLLFVAVLSGSRSAWLYLPCLVALAWLWQRRDPAQRPLLYYALAVLLGFALMHPLVHLSWLAGPGSVTAMDRLSGQGVTSVDIRLHIWREAWLIFVQHPLLGAGFGQFAWQHFLLGPVLRNVDIVGLYTNAHNLVLQLAAETGLAGLVIFFGTLALWTRQVARGPLTLYHWWGCGLIVVLGIHSMLEYPLWYAYFLGIAAIALGLLDATAYRLALRGVGRLAVAAALVLGAVSLVQLMVDYRKLEKLAAIPLYTRTVRAGLDEMERQPFFRSYAELFTANVLKLDMAHLADQKDLNESAMRFMPIGSLVYREALLLALSGQADAARAQMEAAIWAYPDDFASQRKTLEDWARKDPAHCAALLEFALQKNEERHRAAISAR